MQLGPSLQQVMANLPCDGIGGAVKHITPRQPAEIILRANAKQIFEFCKVDKGSTIEFIYIEQKDIEAARNIMRQRYKSAKMISGTIDCHNFTSLSTDSIALKNLSSDLEFASPFNVIGSKMKEIQV